MVKKVLVGVAALLLIVLVGGYLMVRSAVSDESVRPRLAAVLSDALGQPVQIERAHVMFSPKIGAAPAPAGAGTASTPPAAAPADPASTPSLTLKLTAPAGRVAGVDFANLTANASVAGGVVTLDPLAFDVFKGRYHGRMTVDGNGAAPVFAWKADLSGVDLALLLAYAGSPGAMTGTLSGTIDLEGSGADAAQAMKTTKGGGEVHVTDGTLPHLDLVGDVFRALGRPGETPEGSGEAFTTMGGTFALANGALTSPDLTFDSRDVDLDGKANVALDQGTMDVRVNLRLSEELTKRMGTDGQRLLSQNGRATMPATVTGAIDAPTVKIDVGSVMKNAAQQELKKQIDKGIGNLLKKKKPGGGGR